jgi:membrane dipeptidase
MLRFISVLVAAVCALTSVAAWSGDAPAPAAEPPRVSAKALGVHRRLLTLDTHLDTTMHLARPRWSIVERHSRRTDPSQVDLPRMLDGGLDGGFWAIYLAQGPRTPEGHARARDQALRITLRLREMVARHADRFELALTADDAARIAARGRSIVYLSIENGYPLGQDLTLLRTFHDLGVRMFGPVHFANNELGDSATDPKGPEWGGLSPLGRQLVVEANRLGIVLDASHASDAVLDQMLELSQAPIILSHSGFKAVYDHPRNIDDERLRRIAAAGGVISMNSLPAYLQRVDVPPERAAALAPLMRRFMNFSELTPEVAAQFVADRQAIDRQYPVRPVDFDDFMAHLLHALKIVGPEHVAIGLDWDGGGGVIGMDDVTQIPRITARLLEQGYSEAEIGKIWSGNVLRVLREAEATRDRLAQAQRLHAHILNLDAHADVLHPDSRTQYVVAGARSRIDLPRLREGGIDAITLAVAVGPGPRTPASHAAAQREAHERLAIIRSFVADSAGVAELAASAADIERIAAAGRVAVLPAFQNARILGGDVDAIDAWYRDGVRVFGFTHVGNNEFADSSRPTPPEGDLHGGLSPLGREAIARLNDLGVIIDVSQLTAAGVQQVVALSRAPVVATHSAARALLDHARSLADAEIDAIAARGGLVCVPPFSGYIAPLTADLPQRVRVLRAEFGLGDDFPPTLAGYASGLQTLPRERQGPFLARLGGLRPRATVRDYVDHLEHVIKRVGVEHACIGTDFDHGAGIGGFDHAGEAVNVTAELLRRGYPEAAIEKIWGANFLRVFRVVESAARDRHE